MTWCLCNAGGTCIGCLIERKVRHHFGSEGFDHLRSALDSVDTLRAREAVAVRMYEVLGMLFNEKGQPVMPEGVFEHAREVRARWEELL